MNALLLLTGIMALSAAVVLYWRVPGQYFSVAQE
jgi:hypothetical protein